MSLPVFVCVCVHACVCVRMCAHVRLCVCVYARAEISHTFNVNRVPGVDKDVSQSWRVCWVLQLSGGWNEMKSSCLGLSEPSWCPEELQKLKKHPDQMIVESFLQLMLCLLWPVWLHPFFKSNHGGFFQQRLQKGRFGSWSLCKHQG